MARSISVHFLPSHVRPDELVGATVVVIDVLRASTTITCALSAGARKVIPCADIEEARRVAQELPDGEVLLGGEREGLLIEGFDLGNSPAEYTSERVKGRTIVFTTTNGTRALAVCQGAEQVLIGALVNAAEVARRLQDSQNIHLLCAGTRGEISREDVLAAGAMVDHLSGDVQRSFERNDAAKIARDVWWATASHAEGVGADRDLDGILLSVLWETAGGRNVRSCGLEADIELCAQFDSYRCVPLLDRESGALLLR